MSYEYDIVVNVFYYVCYYYSISNLITNLYNFARRGGAGGDTDNSTTNWIERVQ